MRRENVPGELRLEVDLRDLRRQRGPRQEGLEVDVDGAARVPARVAGIEEDLALDIGDLGAAEVAVAHVRPRGITHLRSLQMEPGGREVVQGAGMVEMQMRDDHVLDLGRVDAEARQPLGRAAGELGSPDAARLFRSAVRFLPVEPGVDEQVKALEEIASTLGTRRLIVRTADIGGDKPVSWLDMPHEQNPFLGVRGIRHSFQHEDMFRHQLEAIYRVALAQVEESGETGLHIMFPMIAKVSEWLKAKEIAEQVRALVGAPQLPLGIMVEVPSAALLAGHFAKEVDFFSIGSNDLTQYTLAMDRLHPDLAAEADGFNPALLQLISMTVQAAEANGKWVGVCGNMAADPNLAAILVGLGVNEISVSPANVPALKMLIRSVSYQRLRDKAHKALSLGCASEIRALYSDRSDLT